MKRLLLLITVSLFLSATIIAQETEVILLNYNTLAKKAASIDEQIKDPKKGAKSSTWIKRGKIYQDVFNQGLEQIAIGMGATGLKIFYGEPLSEPEIDSNNVETYRFETINYQFEYGKLRSWTRNNPISERPLNEALMSYQKAVELTEDEKKMSVQEKIGDNLDQLKEQFQKSGQSNYFLGRFEQALEDFESILEVNKFPIYEGVVDTLMINFSGIVARELGRVNNDEEMYRLAIDYYRQLTELGYSGTDMYIQMTRDYYTIGDTLAAIENLKRGLEQYPDSSLLVTVAAQAYYLMRDNENGIKFIDDRIEKKSDCAVAYYWKGLLLTNHDDLSEEDIDEAISLYEKSIEIDPTDPTVWYQVGYVYYAVGANFFELEGYESDPKLRAEFTEKGNKNYQNAVIKLEKTYEMAGDDMTLKSESLDLLKRVYYKLYGAEHENGLYQSTMDRIKNL